MPFLWGDREIYVSIARAAREECARLGVPYSGPDPEAMAGQPCGTEVVGRNGARERYADAMTGLAEQGVIDPALTVYVAGNERYDSPEAHVVEALREQWNDAANALAVKPGHVVVYARNDRTCRALEEHDIEVLALAGGELVRGRGGARCMTMPLRRDPA